jgi:hypothetical protein
MRRRLNQDLAAAEEQEKTLLSELDKLAWVDKAESEIIMLERRADKINIKKQLAESLRQHIHDCETLEAELSVYSGIDEASVLLEEIKKEGKDLGAKYVIEDNYSRIIAENEQAQMIIDKYANIDEVQEFYSETKKIAERINEIDEEGYDLGQHIADHEVYEQDIIKAKATIIALERQLPELCPTCGQRLPEAMHG